MMNPQLTQVLLRPPQNCQYKAKTTNESNQQFPRKPKAKQIQHTITTYQDAQITLTQEDLVIHKYFFPLGNDEKTDPELGLTKPGGPLRKHGWGIPASFPKDLVREHTGSRCFAVETKDSGPRHGFFAHDSHEVREPYLSKDKAHASPEQETSNSVKT